MAGGWGGIVAGTIPGQMNKGFQDTQTQELGQERAGLVNRGLQAELKEQEANRPLVQMTREMQMQDLEDEKHYNAIVRDFLPVAQRAKMSDDPNLVAEALNHYIPDGIRSYQGRKVIDPATRTPKYVLEDGTGGRQAFNSIDEMLEVPFMFTNKKRFQEYMAANRSSRAKMAEKQAEFGYKSLEERQKQGFEIEKLGYGSRLKQGEATHQASLDTEKDRLKLTDDQKNATTFMEGLGVSGTEAIMMWEAAKKGDPAAFNRSKLQAISQIYANSMSPEAAKSNADAFVEYADKMNMSAPGGIGSGGGRAGGAAFSPQRPIGSEEDLFQVWRRKYVADPKDPRYVSDEQVRAAAKKAFRARGGAGAGAQAHGPRHRGDRDRLHACLSRRQARAAHARHPGRDHARRVVLAVERGFARDPRV